MVTYGSEGLSKHMYVFEFMNMISWSCSVHLNGIIQLLCSNNYPALKTIHKWLSWVSQGIYLQLRLRQEANFSK